MRNRNQITAMVMAFVLAMPATIFVKPSEDVQASETYPEPIARYTFSRNEDVELVDNGAKPEIKTDEAGNRYLELKDSVLTEGTKEVWDQEQQKMVSTPASVYVHSTANIRNPYNDTEVAERLKDTAKIFGDDNPVWGKGVTISYWQTVKAAGQDHEGTNIGKDSAVISFSNTREDVAQADTQVKQAVFALMDKVGADDPIFSLGTKKTFTYTGSSAKDRYTGPDGSSYTVFGDMDLKPGTYTVLEGAGMFACFNEACEPDWCYMQPLLNEDGRIVSYRLNKIRYTYKKADWVGDKNFGAVYGTAHGGLQFNSSGAFSFVESDDQDLWMEKYEEADGSVQERVKMQRSLVSRNHVAAHAFIRQGDNKVWSRAENIDEKHGGDENGVWRSPMYHVDENEWQFVVRVIQNDCIYTYIDGVLADEMLYTDQVTSAAVDCNKRFNLGFEYQSTRSSIKGGVTREGSSFENGDALFLNVNGDWRVPEGYGIQGKLGYNGNVVGITILDMLTDAGTTLSIGGQSLGVNSAWNQDTITGTAEGTGIDNVSFFDKSLSEREIAALYSYELEHRPGKKGSDGDIDGGGVTKQDAVLSLKMALKILTDENCTSEELAAANVLGEDGIRLNDAQAILKRALGIPVVFDAESETVSAPWEGRTAKCGVETARKVDQPEMEVVLTSEGKDLTTFDYGVFYDPDVYELKTDGEQEYCVWGNGFDDPNICQTSGVRTVKDGECLALGGVYAKEDSDTVRLVSGEAVAKAYFTIKDERKAATSSIVIVPDSAQYESRQEAERAQNNGTVVFWDPASENVYGQDGKLTWSIRNGRLDIQGSGNYTGAWLPYKNCITSAVVRITDITSTVGMFSGCENLQKVDLEGLDTRNVTNMEYMFYGCIRLQQLDISSFSMQKVEMAQNMLSGCTALTKVTVPAGILCDIDLPLDKEGVWYNANGESCTAVKKGSAGKETYTKVINGKPALKYIPGVVVSGGDRPNLKDAQYVLKIALRIVKESELTDAQKKAADVVGNGDGIKLSDAQAILKKALKIPVIFDN